MSSSLSMMFCALSLIASITLFLLTSGTSFAIPSTTLTTWLPYIVITLGLLLPITLLPNLDNLHFLQSLTLRGNPFWNRVATSLLSTITAPLWLTTWMDMVTEHMRADSESIKQLTTHQIVLDQHLRTLITLVQAWNPVALAQPLARFEMISGQLFTHMDNMSDINLDILQQFREIKSLLEVAIPLRLGTHENHIADVLVELRADLENRMQEIEERQVARMVELQMDTARIANTLPPNNLQQVFMDTIGQLRQEITNLGHHLQMQLEDIQDKKIDDVANATLLNRPISAASSSSQSPTDTGPHYRLSMLATTQPEGTPVPPPRYHPFKLPTDDDINLEGLIFYMATYMSLEFEYTQVGSPHSPRFIGIAPTSGQLCFTSSKKNLGKLIAVVEGELAENCL